jgi:hypothetical protein
MTSSTTHNPILHEMCAVSVQQSCWKQRIGIENPFLVLGSMAVVLAGIVFATLPYLIRPLSGGKRCMSMP